MADKSKIQWTGATWSPMIDCSHASTGCRPCYAERLAQRLCNMGVKGYVDGVVHDDKPEVNHEYI